MFEVSRGNPPSEKARLLAGGHVGLVKADLDDVGSLTKAFEGVTVIFSNKSWCDRVRAVANLEPSLHHERLASMRANTRDPKASML